MRLMEFIFSSCNDETLMDENNDESDDSFDIALKEAKLKRGKSTREYLADLDAEDEKKRQAEEKYTSSISKVSDRSYSKLNESKKSVEGSVICLNSSSSFLWIMCGSAQTNFSDRFCVAEVDSDDP